MNPFERFGIKEVADVQFFALETDTRLGVNAGDIVLYLDTLKISTLETTAEQTEARGGKGNPSLIIWDYGKEITITLQDALMSSESLAVMTAGKRKVAATGAGNTVTIYKTKIATELQDIPAGVTSYTWINAETGARGSLPLVYAASTDTTVVAGKTYYTKSGEIYTAVVGPTGNPSTSSYYELKSGSAAASFPIRIFYTEEADGTSGKEAYEITINAANFPGTYKVVGDTVVRNTNGKDVPFQFVIPKAKMGSEVTLTMEAEGDPSVFDMNLRVLRDEDGAMMKLTRYEMTP